MADRRQVRGGDRPMIASDRRSASVQPRAALGPRGAREALQPETVPGPPPRRRPARQAAATRHPALGFLSFLFTIIIVLLLAAAATVMYGRYEFDREGPLASAVEINVPRGSSLDTIARTLEDQAIIRSRLIFWAGVRLSREEGNLKAGDYLIPAAASMREIMETIVSGRTILEPITIPEGLTSREIVDRLLADDRLTGEITEIPPEGSLLPETYRFARGDTRQDMIDRMRREHDRIVAEVWARRTEGLPIATLEEFVVLASIVERETALADERSRVAAVFINRLNRGMRLQSDPTVMYGRYGVSGGRSLTRSDLDTRTPYNTYIITGLPPGPIGNPGRASLEAVANPSRTNDVYFVADGTGGHAFAETYEEHLRNVARWREIEARQRAAEEAAAAAAAAAEPAPVAAEPAP